MVKACAAYRTLILKMNALRIIIEELCRIFLFVGILLSASSCADDLKMSEQENADMVYLRLILRQSSAPTTRTNPSGGEDGDGREHANPRENDIHDINLFIYTLDGGNGLNASTPSAIGIKKHIFISNNSDRGFEREDIYLDGEYETSVFNEIIPVKDYKPTNDDWIIVIANAGDLSGISNLGNLKNKIMQKSWSETSGVPSNFVMATARTVGSGHSDDGKVIISGNKGTILEPFVAETTIERIAARIDFWYDHSCVKTEGNDKVFEYDVLSDSGAKVQITNIIQVNIPESSSYLFKHVTKTISANDYVSIVDDDILVCADEELSYGMPSNYVLEPTSLKDPANKKFKESTSTDYIRLHPNSVFSSSNSVNSILSSNLGSGNSELADPFDTYTILGYTDENTFIGTKFFLPEYLTGLTFKACYIPGKIYKSADLTEEITPRRGEDFWRFSPSRIDDDNEINESSCKYFSSETAALEYKSNHPEYNGIITHYDKGVCYYTLWLKHSNFTSEDIPDPEYLFAMQYGVVRNNIYRVGVSFSGPGDSKLVLNGPINMRPRIFVRKWNVRKEEEIVF